MWLLILFFVLITLVVSWVLFLYFVVFWFAGLLNRREEPVFPDEWPRLSVVVPCYNEAGRILDKLKNVREIDYPRDRIEVVFADGGSTDGSDSELEAAITPGEPFRVVRCPAGGKINQLNHVFPALSGEIIVNSDADADLAKDALKNIAAEFAASGRVGVVGAYCRPAADAIPVEAYFWASQNKGRFLESDAGSASIVVAACYAFRRGLMERFPEDVVADDVYVAMLANTLGFRSVYSRRALSVETRTPQSYSQFLPHKFRKSNAYLREYLRFIYRLPEMPFIVKVMFMTRTAQQLFMPAAIVVWLLIAGALLTMFRFDIVVIFTAYLLFLFVATSAVFSFVRLPEGKPRYSFGTVIAGYVLTLLILLATGISYAWFRQGSSYAKLDSPGASGRREGRA